MKVQKSINDNYKSMKTIKIIMAALLAFAGISSFISLASTENGAGLFGVFVGCSLFVFAAYRLYKSAIKN